LSSPNSRRLDAGSSKEVDAFQTLIITGSDSQMLSRGKMVLGDFTLGEVGGIVSAYIGTKTYECDGVMEKF
jgi:hypothetical protein